MGKVYDNLEVIEVSGKKIFRCLKCSCELGPAGEGYRRYALKNIRSEDIFQPAYLAPKTDRHFLREYYCPGCAAMFEVEVIPKDAPIIESVKLK